jgi:hypothetical protein
VGTLVWPAKWEAWERNELGGMSPFPDKDKVMKSGAFILRKMCCANSGFFGESTAGRQARRLCVTVLCT